MGWFTRMGRRVWLHDRQQSNGKTLEQFWGAPQERQEIPLRIVKKQQVPKAL